MTLYSNYYAQKIFEIISPVLGDMIAKSAIQLHCKKIGKTEDSIQKDDLPSIAQNIKSGLTIFIGTEGSKMIASKIEAL